MKYFRRFFLILTAFALMLSFPKTVHAGELTDAGLDLGIHSVHYPRYTDKDQDSESIEAVNETMQNALSVAELTGRLATLISSAQPLQASWDGFCADSCLSVHLHASGPISTALPTAHDRVCNLDLREEQAIKPITLEDFFTDVPAACEQMEDMIEYTILPELSAHLMVCELTPLYDGHTDDPSVCFSFDRFGITFYYPQSRFTTLSGDTGSLRFFWWELDHVNSEDGSILSDLGVFTQPDDAALLIGQSVKDGALPGIPVHLGDRMTDVLAVHPPMHDPDNIEGARFFEPEGSAFRDVQLLTDALSVNTYENSVVEGIRTTRFSLYGLQTGKTQINDWRSLLGEADITVFLDADRAELQGLPEGTSDYYTFGTHTLRLHADETGVLAAIILQ